MQKSGEVAACEAWLVKGDAAAEGGALEQAEQCYSSAIAADRTDVEAWTSCGAVQVQRGALQAAVCSFQGAIGCEAHDHDLWLYLGNVQCELGRDAEAVDSYQHALDLACLDTDRRTALLCLGHASFAAGRVTDAMKHYEGAAAIASLFDGSSVLRAPCFARQAAEMAGPARHLLLEQHNPASVDPMELLSALQLSEATAAMARAALCSKSPLVMRRRGVLSREHCAKLRLFMDAQPSSEIDTVDGSPDHQRNLSCAALEALLGADALAALLRLPVEFAAALAGAHAGAIELDAAGRAAALLPHRAQCFVRRYTAATRPWIPFHCDSAALTLNVSLSEDRDFEGGKLLGLHDGQVRLFAREEGEATVHPPHLLHGVTAMSGGARYSLIVFFHTSGSRQ